MDYTIANTCGYTDYCNEVLADISKIELMKKEVFQLETLVKADIEELREENPELAEWLLKKLNG